MIIPAHAKHPHIEKIVIHLYFLMNKFKNNKIIVINIIIKLIKATRIGITSF